MTVVRVKTTSGWQDLQIVGPVGPTGPQGAAGAAPWMPPAVRDRGSSGQSAGFTTPLEPLNSRIPSFTPTLNCWYLTEWQTIAYPVDQAWCSMAVYWETLLAADQTGFTRGPETRAVGHGGVTWETIYAHALWRLSAGVAYSWRVVMSPFNGTWVYHAASTYLETRGRVVGYW